MERDDGGGDALGAILEKCDCDRDYWCHYNIDVCIKRGR